MKGGIHSFHMRYDSMICSNRLQRKIDFVCLKVQPLVHQKALLFTLDSLKGPCCTLSAALCMVVGGCLFYHNFPV